MKVIFVDKENGEIKVAPESIEDLWYLAKLIEEGDQVQGTSFRRFKPEGQVKAVSGEKKKVHVRIAVEKVEFAEESNKLRLTGKIVSGEPEEFCPHGDFHTLDLEPHNPIKIFKKLNAYHEQMLNEAKQASKQPRALIVVLDEEKALFAELQARGIKFGPEIECSANKRDPDSFEEKRKGFFTEIISAIEQKKEGADAMPVVIAGPGFAKDALKKYFNDKKPHLAKKVFWEHADSAERTAVHALLKQRVLEKLVGEQKLQQEYAALEKLKASLGREDGLSAYGLEDVRNAVESRAADELLILDELVRKNDEARAIMEAAKRAGAQIIIFNSEDDAGAEFKAFKIAAMLRYKLR